MQTCALMVQGWTSLPTMPAARLAPLQLRERFARDHSPATLLHVGDGLRVERRDCHESFSHCRVVCQHTSATGWSTKWRTGTPPCFYIPAVPKLLHME